jgi:preprotein translocase subunit YajC
MLFVLQLLADGEGGGPAQPQGSPWGNLLLPMMALGLLFYLFLIRPARRQENERQKLLGALKKNDKVETTGGIIGVVSSIKDNDEEVMLKIDDNSNVRLRVTRKSIVRILGGSSEPGKEQPKDERIQKA